jgi:hypothetical protein
MGTSLYDLYQQEQEEQQKVGPRRDLAPAPPRSLYDQFQAEQAPAPRPGILTRTADAVKGLGRAVVSDPIGTAKSIGSGVVKTGADLAALGTDPTALQRMFVEEGADPRKTAVRAANAGSLLLPAAGRAVGMGIKGIAAADIAAGAGLGAANTPDDPGVGALLGAGMTGASYLGGALRGPRAAPEPPQLGPRAPVRRTARGVEPKPVPMNTFVDEPIIDQLRKRPIMDEVFDAPNPNPAPVASGPMPEGYAMRELGPQLDPAGSDGLNRVAQRYGLFNDEARAALQRRPVADRIFDQPNPNPAPAAVGEFPDGYAMRDIGPQLDPAGSEGLNRAVARSGLVGKDAVDVLMRRDLPSPFDAPNPAPAPASRRSFPEGFTTGAADDVRFRLEGASEAEASLLPKLTAARAAAEKAQQALDRAPAITKGPNAGNKPAGLVRAAENRAAALRELEAQLESAQSAAQAQRDALAKMGGEAPAPVAQGRPQPAASAAPPVRQVEPPAPLTPRASAVPTDAPPVTPRVTPAPEAVTPPMTAPITDPMTPPRNVAAPDNIAPAAPATTPATPTATTPVAPAAAPAVASAPEVPGGRPKSTRQSPPKDGSYLNWRTITDPDAPLGKPTLDRIQALAAKMEPELAAARGKTTMAAQYDEALKTKVIRELFDDPLTVDRQKLKNLSGAQITAVKEVLGENQRMAKMVADEVASGKLSPEDMALAMQRIDQLDNASAEALLVVQQEGSQRGRDLGFLAQQAKLSTDPNVWLVRAQKALGNQPMSADIMTEVRRLAQAATDACKLG